MPTLTVAFCTYKRADRLEKLVAELRAQSCPVSFEILAVNNNSPDNTLEVLSQLQRQPGAPLRVVTEMAAGIVPARNRALTEALDRDILVFIDDDELPQPGLLDAAYDAIVNEGAQCAGGRVEMDFTTIQRPAWLGDELLGFLAAVDHGSDAFWITSDETPVWTANVAYDMRLFRNDPTLRFDVRYNREGADIGGGEDAAMFQKMLTQRIRIRYRPDMSAMHTVEEWRLRRSYFLRLHYRAGVRMGQYRMPDFPNKVFGLPPFMVGQFLGHCLKTLGLTLAGKPGQVRQAMNASNALGTIVGYRRSTHSWRP